MIFTCIALVVGIAVLLSGLYYRIKEREDEESKKIYTIIAVVGAVIVAGTVLKIILVGF